MAHHIPVLAKQILHDWVIPQVKQNHLLLTYLDATFGGGGMSKLLLEQGISVVGCDRDRIGTGEAVAELNGERFKFIHCAFGQLVQKIPQDTLFDGMLMDLGMSNMQLKDAKRGFSFMIDGPLDMRMDTSESGVLITAAQVLREVSESELADIIWRYGEEPWADRIAKAIVHKRRLRDISSTHQLARIVQEVIPKRHSKGYEIHPATKTFQALRIYINRELEELEEGLAAARKLVRPGGYLYVISFHSLEDRIVKREMEKNEWNVMTKKPIIPTAEEVEENIQSRSAKLRIATRTDH
jgi:16S rRNA (cytosine1402-N4)-methyltransferase